MNIPHISLKIHQKRTSKCSYFPSAPLLHLEPILSCFSSCYLRALSMLVSKVSLFFTNFLLLMATWEHQSLFSLHLIYSFLYYSHWLLACIHPYTCNVLSKENLDYSYFFFLLCFIEKLIKGVFSTRYQFFSSSSQTTLIISSSVLLHWNCSYQGQ